MSGKFGEIRTSYVTIRLLNAEKERLEAHARARKVGLSDILREALGPILTGAATAVPVASDQGQAMSVR